MKIGRSVTMRDVARHAGVSHMTVSRVVNGDRAVKAETREAVQAAIRTLRFAPNPAARALSNAEATRVALLHRFPNPGSLGEFVIHLLQASTLAHASLIIREIKGEEEDRSAVDDLLEDSVRGVILAPPLGDDRQLVDMLREEGLAMVAVGSTHQMALIPSVGIDDMRAAETMTEHLLSLGHRRIGFIKGRPTHASTSLRLHGFEIALEKAGLSADPQLVADGLYTYQSGLAAAEALLSLPGPPTAIFASNDDMAAATIAVAHRRGIEVPAALSVCGFDDTPLATTIWPELTTIRQPTLELTQVAFDMVLRLISRATGDAGPETVRLEHQLIRRQSDAAPPSGSA